jgi:phospholipase/lecithinase/hemolysin
VKTKILALLLVTICAPALAKQEGRHHAPEIFVFGDSLSDNGNLTTLHPEYIGEIIPPPYDPQRMSNGPIWVDHVSRILGTAILPEVDGGVNYAVVGATISPDNRFTVFPDVTGFAEVERFLASRGGVADPDAIYVVWIGGNDIDPPADYTEHVYLTLVDMIGRLRAAGARTFLVPNQMDIGQLPVVKLFFGEEYAAALTEMTLLWNRLLDDLPAMFPGARIHISDVYRLRVLVDEHPAAFGFTNTTESCFQVFTDGSVCPNPDQYWFWDGAHPTTRAHKILASLFVLDMLRAGQLRPRDLAR